MEINRKRPQKTPAFSRVKPQKHLTHCQPTTSTWHVSYVQSAILNRVVRETSGDAGRFHLSLRFAVASPDTSHFFRRLCTLLTGLGANLVAKAYGRTSSLLGILTVARAERRPENDKL